MGTSNYTFTRKYELDRVCMIFNFQPENFSVEAASFSKGSYIGPARKFQCGSWILFKEKLYQTRVWKSWFVYPEQNISLQTKPSLRKTWWCKFQGFAVKSLISPWKWRCIIMADIKVIKAIRCRWGYNNLHLITWKWFLATCNPCLHHKNRLYQGCTCV